MTKEQEDAILVAEDGMTTCSLVKAAILCELITICAAFYVTTRLIVAWFS